MIIGVIETITAEADRDNQQVRITIDDETGVGRDIFLTPRAALRHAQEVLDAVAALRQPDTLEVLLSIPAGVDFLVERY